MDEQTEFTSLIKQFETIADTLTLFKMQINALQQHVKTLEKSVKKELKKEAKKETKKDIAKTKRAPSGFAKPTKVTKELCEFMNKPDGTEIARTEVTKALVAYIKNNNLLEQSDNKNNKIVPDQKLKTLLGIDNEELNGLTYFNIQKYMNKHFYKKQSVDVNLTL